MKILLFISLLFVLNFAYAQSGIPNPEFKNTVYRLDESGNTLNNIEKASGTLNRKLQFAGTDFYLKLEGGVSSSLLGSGQTIFVIKLPDADTNPADYVELYKFAAQKEKREIRIGSLEMFGVVKTAKLPKVDVNFSKISPGIYQVTTTKPLAKGSYGFVFDPSTVFRQVASLSTITVYAFDVK